MSSCLHVAIDARATPGFTGGVAEVVRGLVANLHRLPAENFRFSLLVGQDRPDLRALMPGNCTLMPLPWLQLPTREITFPVVGTGVAQRAFGFDTSETTRSIVQRDATGPLRDAGVDVVHGLLQWSVLSDLPLIYHPHDLQHLHLPQFFTEAELAERESVYQFYCGRAALIAVNSRWVADDVMRQYRTPADRLAVVPWAPPIDEVAEPDPQAIDAVRSKFRVQGDDFLLYPAAGWEHKNHVRLVEAAALIRRRKLQPPLLLFTGALKPHTLKVIERAAALGVGDRIRFGAYVSRGELQILYRLARGLVMPSRFEAGSAPVGEAFALGCPVACSAVTSLPAQTDGGALLFDPDDPREVAKAMWRLWTEPDTRKALVERGREVAKRYTWDLTVDRFGVLYRKAAGRTLTHADQDLLNKGPRY